VTDKLPERMRAAVERKMRDAYHADSALDAEAQLTALARELDKTHPGAAASLREGLAETLTILRLDVPPTLARTLRSTNAIESMLSICREHAKNVKRWRDGTMALRWCAAGMLEAGKQVPPRQWTPAPARTPRRAGTACRQRNCQCRPA
jgi:putative transposase